jgi:hypothetical protein
VAAVTFFRITNSHVRDKILDRLLKKHHGDTYTVFWNSFHKSLGQNSELRNKIVHWNVSPAVRDNNILEYGLIPASFWDSLVDGMFITTAEIHCFAEYCKFAGELRAFFVMMLRPDVVASLPEDYKQTWQDVFRNLSCILLPLRIRLCVPRNRSYLSETLDPVLRQTRHDLARQVAPLVCRHRPARGRCTPRSLRFAPFVFAERRRVGGCPGADVGPCVDGRRRPGGTGARAQSPLSTLDRRCERNAPAALVSPRHACAFKSPAKSAMGPTRPADQVPAVPDFRLFQRPNFGLEAGRGLTPDFGAGSGRPSLPAHLSPAYSHRPWQS